MGDEGGDGDAAAGQYGSLDAAGGEEGKNSTQGGQYDDGDVEGRDHFSILLSLTGLFVVLACIGAWLNASGTVTVGPHAPKPHAYTVGSLRKVSICEANFCSRDDGDEDDVEGITSKSLDELAACSAEVRDKANAKGIIELRMKVQFENPMNLPIQLDRFILSFRRDTSSSSSSSSASYEARNLTADPVLGDCRTMESNVTITPEGLNQLSALCSLRVSDVAEAAALWWGGAEVTLLETWEANVTLAPEGQRLATTHFGNEGQEPVRFSVPRRPTTGTGEDIKVTVNADKLGGTAGGRAAAAAAAAAASLGGVTGSGAAATTKTKTTTTPGAAESKSKARGGIDGGDDETRLSTLFGGTAGGLFPSSRSSSAGQCPGVMDLRVGSPSFWLCDVGFESGWRETFSKCAGGGGGGALFESWGGGKCGQLMDEVVMSVRLVVDNPSDLHVTISEFTSKVWLSGHDSSAGSGWLQKVETLTPRTNTTLEFKVSIPWRGSLGELQDVTGKWWKGESLEAFFNAEFNARALGVSLHIAVPDVKFTVPTAGEGGGDQDGGSSDSSGSNSSSGGGGGGAGAGAGGGSTSSLMTGGCTCLLGVCEFIPTHSPPSGVSTWAGKGTGEGCLLSAQCASHKCSWMFKCD